MASHKGGRHYDRLNAISDGPGSFVYNGLAVSVEHHPTPLKSGRKDPVFDADGNPVVDKDGAQVFEKPGQIKKDKDGKVVLGGAPKEVRIKLDTMTVQGVEFPKGKTVLVDEPQLAQKLRCMSRFFEEVESKAKPEKSDKK